MLVKVMAAKTRSWHQVRPRFMRIRPIQVVPYLDKNAKIFAWVAAGSEEASKPVYAFSRS
jgi:hypothetical protein